jgi:glycine/D-amino acid oxidase-like deaminating enzyme/nitrite reductase/ring-hydroxylating ferredoxin subunit
MPSHSTPHTATLPYWADSASFPEFPKISHDLDVDVVVIGGGITGLTTAYLLASAGQSVVLLERARCAAIDTGHTSAHLTMVTDVRLKELASKLGETHAQAVWDGGLAAIAQIEAIVREHRIDCGFSWIDGYLHAPDGRASRDEVSDFTDEARLASRLGFDAAFVEDVPFVGGPGVRFEGQARIHPRKYLAGVAKAFSARGGQIFEASSADEFQDKPLGVKVNGYRVLCRDIVIATHNPLVGIASTTDATIFQTKLALYTSYVVAGAVQRGTVPDALFWDTADPYRYFRIEPRGDYDLVILGGEDHKTGQIGETNACYDRLARALVAKLPKVSLRHQWSGQVIETPDGLPFIGKMADHQYVATGFSGNGLTFGTLGALIISDEIGGLPNPWSELFDPDRGAVRRGLWEYLKENKDYPYYMIRDRFAGTESRSLRAVHKNEGKVIEYRGRQVAAYRDPSGALTLRSANCTHMGCIVAWNEAEKTWDCPCHGSRFTPEGNVLAGPAESSLEPTKP